MEWWCKRAQVLAPQCFLALEYPLKAGNSVLIPNKASLPAHGDSSDSFICWTQISAASDVDRWRCNKKVRVQRGRKREEGLILSLKIRFWKIIVKLTESHNNWHALVFHALAGKGERYC